MQTFGNTVRAVRLRSSKQDSRPCDALRRYVQRAEERAAALPTMPRRGPPNTARRTRWGPCAAHCVEQPVNALRLYALARFGFDATDAWRRLARARASLRWRSWPSWLRGQCRPPRVQPPPPRPADQRAPDAARLRPRRLQSLSAAVGGGRGGGGRERSRAVGGMSRAMTEADCY